MLRYSLFIGIIAMHFTASLAEDVGVTLRPIWREGQSSRYRVTQTEQTTANMPGVGQQQSTMDLTLEITWRVKTADPAGGGVGQMTVNSLVMKLTDGEGKVHTVTATQSEEELKKMRDWIAALTGSTVEVSVGPDGAIGNVRGIEALHRKAPELTKRMNEKFFQDLAMDLAVMNGGKGDVKPGQNWRHSFTNSHSAGEITFDATTELQAVQKIAGINVAVVSRKARLSLKADLDDLPADAPPVQVRLSDSGYSGQILFDLSRHEIVGGQFNQTVEISVDVTHKGQKITSTTKEVSSTQLLRLSEE